MSYVNCVEQIDVENVILITKHHWTYTYILVYFDSNVILVMLYDIFVLVSQQGIQIILKVRLNIT